MTPITGKHELPRVCSTCIYGRYVTAKHGIVCGKKKRKVNKVCRGWTAV